MKHISLLIALAVLLAASSGARGAASGGGSKTDGNNKTAKSELDEVMASVKSTIGTMLGNNILRNLLQNGSILTRDMGTRPSASPSSGRKLTRDGQNKHLSYFTFDATKQHKSMTVLDYRVNNPIRSAAVPDSTQPDPNRTKPNPSDVAKVQKCPPGSILSDGSCAKCPIGKYSAGGKCTVCPPGTYSNAVGKTACNKCDLNFALYRQSGMDRCDMCPDEGATRNSNSCYRKVNAKCDPIPKGFEFAKLPYIMCNKTIDNDFLTDGRSGDRDFLIKHKLVYFPTFFKYAFQSPIRLRRIAIWHKSGCCKGDLKNVKFEFSNNVTCAVDGVRDAVVSTDVYTFINYCESDNVKEVELQVGEKNRDFSISEISFYAE